MLYFALLAAAADRRTMTTGQTAYSTVMEWGSHLQKPLYLSEKAPQSEGEAAALQRVLSQAGAHEPTQAGDWTPLLHCFHCAPLKTSKKNADCISSDHDPERATWQIPTTQKTSQLLTQWMRKCCGLAAQLHM